MTEQNIATGYIKLFRSIRTKGWYRKSEHVHLFLHLLLTASHSGYETFFSGKTVRIGPGQLVTGRKKLSDETGINESKIERLLKFFEIEQQIEQQKSNTSRLISIVNWASYQKTEQQSEQQSNNDRTTTEQRVNTIQEGKEGKKSKKGKELIPGVLNLPGLDSSDEKKSTNIPFETFWNMYGKKEGKEESKKQWQKLTDLEREKAIQHIPSYLKFKPDKTFRKNPVNYLRNRIFDDPIEDYTNTKVFQIKNKSGAKLTAITEEAAAAGFN